MLQKHYMLYAINENSKDGWYDCLRRACSRCGFRDDSIDRGVFDEHGKANWGTVRTHIDDAAIEVEFTAQQAPDNDKQYTILLKAPNRYEFVGGKLMHTEAKL